MPKSMISARISSELDEGLDLIAEATKRSKSHLMEEALQEFVAKKAWMISAVKQAIKAADEDGRYVAEDDMSAWLKTWGTDGVVNLPRLRNRDEA